MSQDAYDLRAVMRVTGSCDSYEIRVTADDDLVYAHDTGGRPVTLFFDDGEYGLASVSVVRRSLEDEWVFTTCITAAHREGRSILPMTIEQDFDGTGFCAAIPLYSSEPKSFLMDNDESIEFVCVASGTKSMALN